MYLQERIEELESGILDISESKVEVIGFLSPERLEDYYKRNIQCAFSHGWYDYEDLKFQYIKDNALFIIKKFNIEIEKYQFLVLKKDLVKYKIKDKTGKTKIVSKVYKIRKCNFTKLYNYIDSETNLLFDNLKKLEIYFESKYKKNLYLIK